MSTTRTTRRSTRTVIGALVIVASLSAATGCNLKFAGLNSRCSSVGDHAQNGTFVLECKKNHRWASIGTVAAADDLARKVLQDIAAKNQPPPATPATPATPAQPSAPAVNQPAPTRSTAPTSSLTFGSATTQSTLLDFLVAEVNDVWNMWSTSFANAGRQLPSVNYRFLNEGEVYQEACTNSSGAPTWAGDEDEYTGVNSANYCPADNTIYISVPWIYHHVWVLHLDQQRRGGDFGAAVIIAHEMGHFVQTVAGITNRPGATTLAPRELQADCFAGEWANHEYYSGYLEAGDLQIAASTLYSLGDDSFDRYDHHGTSDQRLGAFLQGYNYNSGCTLDLDLR